MLTEKVQQIVCIVKIMLHDIPWWNENLSKTRKTIINAVTWNLYNKYLFTESKSEVINTFKNAAHAQSHKDGIVEILLLGS